MDELLYCSFCEFQCSDHYVLLKHTRAHENEPNFIVYCSICGHSAKKWSSLKKHLHRCHKNVVDDTENSSKNSPPITDTDTDTLIDTGNDSMISSTFTTSSQHDSALFLLKMSNSLSLTHAGVDEMCELTQSFVETVTDKIKDRLFEILERNNIDKSSQLSKELAMTCKVDDIFSGLSTRATREAFYRQNFQYVVIDNNI